MFAQVQQKIKAAEATLKAIGKSAQTDMAADAVNHTVFYSRLQVITHMKNIFDRPTPRTLNSIFIKPLATAQKPEAKIFVNDDLSKGTSPAQWLRAEASGNTRRDKRMERALKIAGILESSQQVMGYGKSLDKYGNLPGGQVKQMLSALQAGNDATQDSKDPRKQAKWKIARRRADGKPFGIFRMKGQKNELFMIFTRQQLYKPRFKFFDVVQRSWNEKIKDAWLKAWAVHVAKTIPASMK